MNSKNNFTLSRFNIGDDYIGTESCMDLQNDIEVMMMQHSDTDTCKTNGGSGNALKSSSSSKKKVTREFPPPIPLLSSKPSSSHVPWALKRYCTSDGRLILKEEKVKQQHCEYFRAHRSNGRLTLQLVDPILDDDEEEDGVADHEESNGHSVVNGPSDSQVQRKTSVDEVPMENDEEGGVGGTHAVGKNSFNCNIARSSPSCVFGVPMHPVRTVHG